MRGRHYPPARTGDSTEFNWLPTGAQRDSTGTQLASYWPSNGKHLAFNGLQLVRNGPGLAGSVHEKSMG
jgi:hypothetical protein